MSAPAVRIAALWFPDWPIQAARYAETLPEGAGAGSPIGVLAGGAVKVCNTAARRAGVHRGMRVRAAQAVCPELVVWESQPEREGAVFAEIVESLDAVASSIEVIRPGFVVVDAAAAARFHGGEATAVEMLVDAAARQGLDMTVGVADELATAIIAARDRGLGAVVPPGASRQFLAPRSAQVLAVEVSLGCPPELVAQFVQLGLPTLGDVAQLPLHQFTSRFGNDGRRCHAIASAQPDRRVAPELAGAELDVWMRPEDPLERVDAAAFAARQLAAQLHQRLSAAGLSCLRLRVSAQWADGTELRRIWRTRAALSESATADRVRWQLDGWLVGNQAEGGIVGLGLEPLEVAQPEQHSLVESGTGSAARAQQVIERVQSQLGIDKVVQPVDRGGRGVAERVDFVPYGERVEPAPPGAWPGRIPAPLPAQLELDHPSANHPAARIRMINAEGHDVFVTEEALLSAEPAGLAWGKNRYLVTAWAGPWPVDTGWWTAAGTRLARLQIVGTDQEKTRAWLLNWQAGRWTVEASYV
ncbi:DNA polymerase Y family protein [uncultured Corynebacterium sp.]|uniref:Y-family DNA polymerase n=1 Tax=uncultured Corynebacterium sp. TaxID=159447 RepID=UPI0025FA3C2F|nr:DNA polymerase Y family protein [uncultured Corynebacterium sp.]